MIKTIIANGKEPLPPFIIAPGKQIINNWINKKLISKERIIATLTSYINNEIALQYINYLIKHSQAGLNKPWKILLLNGHKSHKTNKFQLKAAKNHIKLF